MPASRSKCDICGVAASPDEFISSTGLCWGCAMDRAIEVVVAMYDAARQVAHYDEQRGKWVNNRSWWKDAYGPDALGGPPRVVSTPAA